MYRRQRKEPSNLWKYFPNYSPINNLDKKPLFDEAKVTDEHRILGQIIRENWELIHPLARDYMISSANEWRILYDELNTLRSTFEITPRKVDDSGEDHEKRRNHFLLEKEMEIERVKEQVADTFKEVLERKEQELAEYKMLVELAKKKMSDPSHNNSLSNDSHSKDFQIAKLENLIQELRDKCMSQEIEAMTVQTSISKNFQQQITKLTSDFYEKQEQIDKLREILAKAKEQLIVLREKNDEMKQNYHKLSSDKKKLEQMLEDRDEKLKRVMKMIESLE